MGTFSPWTSAGARVRALELSWTARCSGSVGTGLFGRGLTERVSCGEPPATLNRSYSDRDHPAWENLRPETGAASWAPAAFPEERPPVLPPALSAAFCLLCLRPAADVVRTQGARGRLTGSPRGTELQSHPAVLRPLQRCPLSAPRKAHIPLHICEGKNPAWNPPGAGLSPEQPALPPMSNMPLSVPWRTAQRARCLHTPQSVRSTGREPWGRGRRAS